MSVLGINRSHLEEQEALPTAELHLQPQFL